MGDIIILLLVFLVVGRLLRGVFGGFSKSSFRCKIYNEAGELLNTGSTVLGFIHRDTRRPCRAPKGFMELLEKNL